MIIIHSYPVAVAMCFVAMICWGSWVNTRKLVGHEWKFRFFYLDYSIGVLLLGLFLALTMGSMGTEGITFIENLKRADSDYLVSAFLGGIIFNVANILIIAAMDIAGMAVAFPIGIGLALVVGVISTYLVDPAGEPNILMLGVAFIVAAIITDSIAYRRIPTSDKGAVLRGIIFSISGGVLMGFFYRFVAASIPQELADIALPGEAAKLTPYTALVIFSLGILVSTFIFNCFLMFQPVARRRIALTDYFTKGNFKAHAIGMLGGIIWGLGMSFSILAGDSAGYAVSYGLGQGSTMVAALWGVFVWKEFKAAPKGTNRLLALMFVFYVIGLCVITMARGI